MAKPQVYIALWLLTVVLLPSTFKVGYITYFYANQAEITQKHCVNKSRPELECNGKCYLTKQLTQSDKSNPKPAALKLLESNNLLSIVNEPTQFRPKQATDDQLLINWVDHYAYLHLQHVFRPPIA